jgi:hypothetical protein
MAVISSKIQLHIEQSLAFSGLVILEQQLMFRLRPDLWSAAHELNCNWTPIENYIAGLSPSVKLFEVRFEGRGNWARVAARSSNRLAERVTMITGLVVEKMRNFRAEESTAGTRQGPALAAVDVPPPYPCQARKDWFERRGLQDTQFADPGPVRKRAS